MSEVAKNLAYKDFIAAIKSQVQSAQIKAAVSVNRELLQLYWFMGSQIVEKQETARWGDGLVKQMSRDLQEEFPDMKGFSIRNIKYMKQWFKFWHDSNLIGQQLVAQNKNPITTQVVTQLEQAPIFQIPWGQNLLIISKASIPEEAIFYVQKTIENNWSRAVLTHQIELGLYGREGKALSNFDAHLPAPQSDLAKQTLKDPYCFDFLTLSQKHNEKELEAALTENISQFLLELGAGFAFIGKQYKLSVSDKDYYIDLLFYHIKLRCYMVVELKTVEFKPEFAGKLNFYISAVDDLLATDQDKPTIGILICKSKDKTIVEYALKDMQQPLGVSEYQLTQQLPEPFQSSLPSIEEIEKELGGLGDE
jgi:predicted nuclease of restriction endonuclease-like (RecB) superfamily